MAKMLRIESADNTENNAEVAIWEKGINGEPDKIAKIEMLLADTWW